MTVRQTPFIIPILPGGVQSQVDAEERSGGGLSMISYDQKSIVRLIRGNLRSPTDMVEFGNTAVGVYLSSTFQSPGSTETITWSGIPTRRNGQQRTRSGKNNVQLDLNYFIKGGSPQEIRVLSDKVLRFFEEARRFQEEGQEERIYLQYRWYDELNDLPPPVFGQWSTYLEVLAAEVKAPPDITKRVHSKRATNGDDYYSGEIICTLTCEPTARGLRERMGIAAGTVVDTPEGVVPSSSTQFRGTDPAFYDIVNGGLNSYNDQGTVTSKASTGGLFSPNVAIVHGGASGGGFTSLGSGISTTMTQSCLCKRTDGTAVQATDFDFYFNASTAVTPTVTAYRDGWYWCYATTSTAVVINGIGVDMAANASLMFDYFHMEESSFATAPGLPRSITKNGDDDTTSPIAAGAGYLQYDISSNYDEHDLNEAIYGEFALAFWVTPWCDPGDVGAGTYYLFYFDYPSTSDFYCTLDFTTPQISVSKDGTSANFSVSLSFNTPTHLAFVQRDDNMEIYQDGASLGTLSVIPGFANAYDSAGVMYLGGGSGNSPANMAYDAYRVWDKALTTTQVSKMYTVENYAKVAGHIISPAPYFQGGGSPAYNYDQGASGVNNFVICAGLAGNTDSDIDLRLDTENGTQTYKNIWIGRKVGTNTFPSYENLFMNFTSITISGRVGNNGANSVTNAGDEEFEQRQSSADLEILRGDVKFLAAMNVQTDPTTKPYYHFESQASPGTVPKASFFTGKSKTHSSTGGSWKLYDLGDLKISYDMLPFKPTSVSIGLLLEGYTTTEQIDFISLIPAPYCEIAAIDGSTFTVNTTNSITIANREASIVYPSFSGGTMLAYRGPKLTLVPGRPNYLYFAFRRTDDVYDLNDRFSIDAYYTPRFVWAGGPI